MTCGHDLLDAQRTKGAYQYLAGGLESVVIKDMDLLVCSDCGQQYPLFSNVLSLNRTIAKKLLEVPIGADEAYFLRKHVGLTVAEMADIFTSRGTPVTKKEIIRYENGANPIPETYQAALKNFVKPRVFDAESDYVIEITTP